VIFPLALPLGAESETLKASGLEAVIVDNEAWKEHHARYNGAALLSRGPGFTNIFHTLYGGFNLENMFDAEQEPPATTTQPQNFLYEPRNILMRLHRISADTVELSQPPGPHWGIENRTRFTVREPHCIDVEFECIPRRRTARGNFVGLFWANYVNSPEDGGYYFLGRRRPGGKLEWIRAFSKAHNDESTFLPVRSLVKVSFQRGYGSHLWSNFSPARYVYPFYYGLVQNQLFLLMFDNDRNIRFAHSPTGGGTPAWDFQFIIPQYKVGKRYGFHARIVLKEFVSREDVIEEYEHWSGKEVVRPKE
jgi:hypothetical protein